MKNIPTLQRVALLAFALATAGLTAASAQTTSTTDSTSTPASTDSTGKKHHKHKHDSILTADEKARLKSAEKKVLASNSELKTEHDQLKQQKASVKGKNATASVEDRENYHMLKKDYKQKLHLAMLKADPSLAPIFAKLKAEHKAHKGDKNA